MPTNAVRGPGTYRNVKKSEMACQSGAGVSERWGEKCFDFRAEQEMIGRGCIKKRLHANRVAGEEQEVVSEIHDSKGKDAVELLRAGGAGFLVQMHDDFGIGARMETMTARFEASAQFPEVINLTVEYEPYCSIFI